MGVRLFVRQVLAPGNDLHAEGLANSRDFRPDIAQTEDAEGLA